MADYTITDFTVRTITINVGEPFGYVPFCFVQIRDSWIADLVTNDNIIMPRSIMDVVLNHNKTFPTLLCPGGSRSNFNNSAFSSYTYNITSPGATKVHTTRLNIVGNILTSTASIRPDLQIKRSGSDTWTNFSPSPINTTVGRVCPAWLIGTATQLLGVDYEYSATMSYGADVNAFINCANNNGLPYGVIAGTTIAAATSQRTYRFYSARTYNLDELDYKESAIPTEDDPYAAAGESEPGGAGDGTFDFSSTVIPIPGLPNIGATDTGFITLYKPSAAQLKSLANYMWAGAFDITQFKKLFADPMDAILGLHIIPTTSAHPASGSASLVIGNIDTGLTMPTCLEQYYEADMGEVNVPAKWGAYLDYSPYTKLSLYLPYIGFVPLSPDDCMQGSIKVVYHVDVLSGTCMAFVYCVSNRGADGHTLYMFNGSCACDCPVTSGQYRSALEGLLGIAGSIGRVAAGDVAGGIKDAISNVTSMVKPEIGRSGSFGGSGGLMGIQYPYLVLTVPHMCIPGQQNTYVGYPSYVTKTIGDLSGFTSIDVSHLNNMTCTQAETEEIISLLEEGVIL